MNDTPATQGLSLVDSMQGRCRIASDRGEK